jgi:CheY-like chemotaxis protein
VHRPGQFMMKIMYVEDNPANISLLQRIARMGGHQVINYTNGEVALNNFAQDDPDLVLMDLQLEGRITGLDVVKQLRARGFTTPIVAVTAYAMVGDRERCIEAGCNSYLSKPLPVAELVELVKDYEGKADKVKAAAPEAKPEAAAQPAVEASAAPVEVKVEVKDEPKHPPVIESTPPPVTETPAEPSLDTKPSSTAALNGKSAAQDSNAKQSGNA